MNKLSDSRALGVDSLCLSTRRRRRPSIGAASSGTTPRARIAQWRSLASPRMPASCRLWTRPQSGDKGAPDTASVSLPPPPGREYTAPSRSASILHCIRILAITGRAAEAGGGWDIAARHDSHPHRHWRRDPVYMAPGKCVRRSLPLQPMVSGPAQHRSPRRAPGHLDARIRFRRQPGVGILAGHQEKWSLERNDHIQQAPQVR